MAKSRADCQDDLISIKAEVSSVKQDINEIKQ